MKDKLMPIVLQLAYRYGIAPRFLVALIELESSWNTLAVRHEPGYIWIYSVKEMSEIVGCNRSTMEMLQRTSWGLGQIMGAVAYEHGLRTWATKLLDPEVNIKFVCEYIQILINRWNLSFSEPLDLYAAYNAGSVRKADGRYVNATPVCNFKKIYQSIDADFGLFKPQVNL